MVALLAIGSLLARDTENVADYFPLVKGTTWVYEDTVGESSQTYTDAVGNPQSVGGVEAFPIVTTVNGQVDGSTFYRYGDNQVLVVAFEQNQPLAAPYPILSLRDGKGSWQYDGSTQWYGEPAPLHIDGTCRKGPSKDVLGNKVATLEVTIEARIGPERAVGMRSKQTALYAKGIGLCELKETITFDKKKTQRTRTLSAFTPGAVGQ